MADAPRHADPSESKYCNSASAFEDDVIVDDGNSSAEGTQRGFRSPLSVGTRY